MRNLILSAVLTVVMITAVSCGDKMVHVKSPCFITQYKHIVELNIWNGEDFFRENCGDTNLLIVIRYVIGSGDLFNCHGTDNSWFLENRSAKYGDTSYDRDISFLAGTAFGFEHHAIYPDMKTISIVSTEDYDAAHPAGSDLGGIIRYSGSSKYPFIRNGYVATYGSLDEFATYCPVDEYIISEIEGGAVYEDDLKKCVSPVFKYVSELTEEDLYLAGDTFVLTFMKEPANKTSHDFTLTMNGADGKVYTVEFSYDFGGAE